MEALLTSLAATIVFAILAHRYTGNRRRSRRKLRKAYSNYTWEQIKKDLSHVEHYKAYHKDTAIFVSAAALTLIGFILTMVLLAVNMGVEL